MDCSCWNISGFFKFLKCGCAPKFQPPFKFIKVFRFQNVSDRIPAWNTLQKKKQPIKPRLSESPHVIPCLSESIIDDFPLNPPMDVPLIYFSPWIGHKNRRGGDIDGSIVLDTERSCHVNNAEWLRQVGDGDGAPMGTFFYLFLGKLGRLGVGKCWEYDMKIEIINETGRCVVGFCLGRLGSWERTDETKTWIAIPWWSVNSFEVSTRCLGKMCSVTFEIPHQTIENCLRAGSCLQEVYWAGPKSLRLA